MKNVQLIFIFLMLSFQILLNSATYAHLICQEVPISQNNFCLEFQKVEFEKGITHIENEISRISAINSKEGYISYLNEPLNKDYGNENNYSTEVGPSGGANIGSILAVGAIGAVTGALMGLVIDAMNPTAESSIAGMAIAGLVIFEIDFLVFNTLPLDFLK